MKIYLKLLLQRLQIFLLKYGFINNTSRYNDILFMSYIKTYIKNKQKTDALDDLGYNVFSLTYEDGILLYIFSLIGMKSKLLVDIGAGTIIGSSISNLIINHGFSGLLIEGNPGNCKLLNDYYSRHPETSYHRPKVVSTFVTAENINQIIMDNNISGDIDLLCIDIDGVDYFVLKEISLIQPRVIVVEYQDILGPEKSLTVPYKPDFNVRDYPVNNNHNNYCGASLRAFVKLGKQKGYRLIGCNRGGWNAFFLRNDIINENLCEVEIESCFKFSWSNYGYKTRRQLVESLEWEEV